VKKKLDCSIFIRNTRFFIGWVVEISLRQKAEIVQLFCAKPEGTVFQVM